MADEREEPAVVARANQGLERGMWQLNVGEVRLYPTSALLYCEAHDLRGDCDGILLLLAILLLALAVVAPYIWHDKVPQLYATVPMCAAAVLLCFVWALKAHKADTETQEDAGEDDTEAADPQPVDADLPRRGVYGRMIAAIGAGVLYVASFVRFRPAEPPAEATPGVANIPPGTEAADPQRADADLQRRGVTRRMIAAIGSGVLYVASFVRSRPAEAEVEAAVAVAAAVESNLDADPVPPSVGCNITASAFRRCCQGDAPTLQHLLEPLLAPDAQ